MKKRIKFQVPLLFIPRTDETIKEKKKRKELWYQLGWKEKESEVWFCDSCSSWRHLTLCDRCMKCECSGPCNS